MIHNIYVRNYQSVANQAKIDFTVGLNAPDTNNYVLAPSNTRISLAHAIMGGNASGKTTMIKALTLIGWIITESFDRNHRRNLPVKGFAGFKKPHRPTELSVAFEIKGSIYEYSIALDKSRIISENMSVRTLSSKRVTAKKVLSRQWDKKKKQYTIDGGPMGLTEPYWTNDELGNSSIICAAARFGNEYALNIVHYWNKLKSNVEIDDRFMPYQFRAYRALSGYEKDENIKERAEADIRKYDLGIDKFGNNGTILHKYGDATFELEVDEESSGTQQFLALKGIVDDVLENGGIAVIDELNTYLHPLMSSAIINKFLDSKINKGKGQLLFSTHDLQTFELLDKYQISLADKDNMGMTSIKRLDSRSKVRPTDNHIKKYLSGSYGAINKIEL